MRSRLNNFMPSHYSVNNDLESSSIPETITRMPYIPSFPGINYAPTSSMMEEDFGSSSSSRSLMENMDILNFEEEDDDIDLFLNQSEEDLSTPETDVTMQENTSRESCNMFDTSKFSTLGKRTFDETSSTSSEDVSDEEIMEALGFLASPNQDDSSLEMSDDSSINSLFLSPNSATESMDDSISSPLVLKLKISNNKRKAGADEDIDTTSKKIKVDSSLKENIDNNNMNTSPSTKDASLVLKLKVSNNKRKSDADEDIDTASKKIKFDNIEDDDNSLMFSPDSLSSPVFVNLKTPNTAETFVHSPLDIRDNINTDIFSSEPEQGSSQSSSSGAMCPSLDEYDLAFLGDDYDDIENFGL
ncbi:MAG: hypothetical protein WBJ81_00415 [Rickettsiales bacterium]